MQWLVTLVRAAEENRLVVAILVRLGIPLLALAVALLVGMLPEAAQHAVLLKLCGS